MSVPTAIVKDQGSPSESVRLDERGKTSPVSPDRRIRLGCANIIFKHLDDRVMRSCMLVCSVSQNLLQLTFLKNAKIRRQVLQSCVHECSCIKRD